MLQKRNGIIFSNGILEEGSTLLEGQALLDTELENARDKKRIEAKAELQRVLRENTPINIGDHDEQPELAGKSFKINVEKHLPLFETIMNKLQRRIADGEVNPPRSWGDANGDRVDLTYANYEHLVNHLETRDESAHIVYKIDKDAIEAANTVEDVEDIIIGEGIE